MRRETVILEDDLVGGEAAENVSFGLDGREYEIDLSGQHAAALREVLAANIAAGRRVGRKSPARARLEPLREAQGPATMLQL